MEFEGFGSKGTRVIERKRSVTDGQTDGIRKIDYFIVVQMLVIEPLELTPSYLNSYPLEL